MAAMLLIIPEVDWYLCVVSPAHKTIADVLQQIFSGGLSQCKYMSTTCNMCVARGFCPQNENEHRYNDEGFFFKTTHTNCSVFLISWVPVLNIAHVTDSISYAFSYICQTRNKFQSRARHYSMQWSLWLFRKCRGGGEGGYITINRFLKAKAMATNTRFFYFWYLTGSRTQNDLNVFTHAREC